MSKHHTSPPENLLETSLRAIRRHAADVKAHIEASMCIADRQIIADRPRISRKAIEQCIADLKIHPFTSDTK